jgi:hypothetical protein
MSVEKGQIIKVVKFGVVADVMYIHVQNVSSSAIRIGILECKQYDKNGTVSNGSFVFDATLETGENAVGHYRNSLLCANRIDLISISNTIDLKSINPTPVRGVVRRGFWGWKLEGN